MSSRIAVPPHPFPKSTPGDELFDAAGFSPRDGAQEVGSVQEGATLSRSFRCDAYSLIAPGRPPLDFGAEFFRQLFLESLSPILAKGETISVLWEQVGRTRRVQLEPHHFGGVTLKIVTDSESRTHWIHEIDPGTLSCSDIPRGTVRVVARALAHGTHFSQEEFLPLVPVDGERRETRGNIPLQSAIVSPASLIEVLSVIDRVFPAGPDQDEAKRCYKAFARGVPFSDVDSLERGLTLTEYRVFRRDDGKAIGVGGLYQVERFGASTFFLGWLGVVQEARGEGLGRSLVQHLMDRARELGGSTLYTHTPLRDPDFAAARGMYRSLGFRPEPYLTFSDPIYKRAGEAAQPEVVLVKDL